MGKNALFIVKSKRTNNNVSALGGDLGHMLKVLAGMIMKPGP